jgi:hypothetical protein
MPQQKAALSGFMLVDELIQELTVHDESMISLANDLKAHPLLHICWLTHLKNARNHLVRAENSYNDLVAEKVSTFARTATSASAVTNYAKYDVPAMPEVRMARDQVDYYKNLVSFFDDVQRVISKRGDILVALTKLDQDAIVAQLKGNQVNYFDARQARIRWNKLEDMIQNGQWSKDVL